VGSGRQLILRIDDPDYVPAASQFRLLDLAFRSIESNLAAGVVRIGLPEESDGSIGAKLAELRGLVEISDPSRVTITLRAFGSRGDQLLHGA
jgi:hypothetical protein